MPPEVGSRLLGGSFEIGKPVAARMVAYFQLTDDNSLGTGYGSSQMRSRSGNSRIMFVSDPRLSERIAAFSVPDAAPPQVRGRGYGPWVIYEVVIFMRNTQQTSYKIIIYTLLPVIS